METAVEAGIQLATHHCKEQFKWDRWNCPESAFVRQGHQPIYRETALVQAMTAAGVVYVTTKRCSQGVLNCGCVRHHREHSNDEDWLWGGCSDNVKIGIELAHEHLHKLENEAGISTFIKMHNTIAGQNAVRHCLELQCKCYGLSGSCTTKVCWKQLCPFHKIALDLRFRYDQAVRLDFLDDTLYKIEENSAVEMKKSIIPDISSRELIYSVNSPNYCLADEELGWAGTLGRTCSRRQGVNVSAREGTSCRTLCHSCNHSVQKKRVVVSYHCNCTFLWCCKVECKVCKDDIEEFYCA